MANRFRAILLLALAGLALLLSAGMATAAERTVSVTARATIEVPNDSAGLGFSVSAERGSRGAALRTVSGRLRTVIAAVQRTAGVGPGDVTTGAISVRKRSRGKHVLYRASEGISVILHQPNQAGELVSAAIAAGATGVRGPRFFVGDSEAAYGRALAAAFDKAKAKATTLATEAGAVLGPAISIQEGSPIEIVPQESSKGTDTESGCATVPVNGAAASRCTANPPTKPGTSTVTATVGVVFALQ
ncbi:MAG: uncharacterized protein QOI84_511 [Solirubrobacterales bacterium]|nr:uncharacterized protein [Solirubrobacterales bacterium]